MTKIEWTEETWNPVVGCSKVSEGCKNCYAITMANRLAHIHATTELYMDTVTKTAGGLLNWTGVVNVSEGAMDKPLWTRKPTMFFVNSMSDLFHESVPFEVIHRVFAVMALCPQHTFQILTKRADRMAEYFKKYENGIGDKIENRVYQYLEYMHGPDGRLLPALREAGWMWDETYANNDGSIDKDTELLFEHEGPLPNVWMGVSVENQKCADERIPFLLQVPAAIRFLSCEPLLGKISLAIEAPEWDDAGASRIYSLEGRRTDMGRPCSDTNKIDWVIAGGESGAGSRPMHPDWVRSLRDQCIYSKVPFFFKQWGDWGPHPPKPVEGKYTGAGIFIKPDGRYGDQGEWWDGTATAMDRKGKGKTGKKLDGIIHQEFPKK